MNASSLKLFLRISLLVMLAVTLSACGGSQSDLDAYVAQVKARSGGPIDPLPEVIKPKKFEYEAEDMRDPFSGGPQEQAEQVEDVDTSVGGLRPDPTRRKEVLEGFELDSLKMVGTFFIEEVLYALISDPDGLIHRVRPEN
jgi:type IV pilus assembly protein PilP